ncbi:uncharacterized protein Tco025E_03201 [Trypanosoma conorhini]|uniref:Uncharacterized protein n=1 Tax=Trypanosoma conorhini TaxID=83891 RepID=A0A3R7NRN6_9TRYP|nr:uncharacterized protein Tco025E_03201 [Trypanosoma conorhini]RNF22359.1 hypothetical protein Tco025E_03201 [Trypanosoma conorhini]
MNQLNVNAATREELVEVVKQLRQQLRQHQASTDRAKEHKRQVDQLKQNLREKANAVRALEQQNAMLSEKSAADEETISVLIKQLEEMSAGVADAANSDGVVEARAVSAKAAAAGPEEKRAVAAKVVQASVKGSGGAGAAGGASGDSPAPAKAAAIIAQQNEEMAKLEMKVRELTEVNTFYTAIVSHHDEAERLQVARQGAPSATTPNAAAPAADTASLRDCIRALENEREVLQRVVRQQSQEKQALMNELQEHRAELSRLELDLVAAERWKVSASASFETAESITPVYASSSPPAEEFPSSRTPARSVNSMQYKSGRGRSIPSPAARLRSTGPPPETHSPARGLASRTGLPQLEILPEIRLRNPSKQEKLLLERVEEYRKCIEEMQTFEVDRRRGFDEIERARAELFTEMNTKLEEQRREIQRLNKRLAATVSACRNEDERRTVESRSVKDAITSPIVFPVHGGGERASMPSFNACASASAGEDRVLAEEEADGVNAADEKALGGDGGAAAADAAMDEEAILECLGAVGVSAETPAQEEEGKEEGAATDTEFGGGDGAVKKLGNSLEAEEGEWQEMQDAPLPKVDWAWQLLAKEEEIGRLGILCEEGDAAVQMLQLSRAAMAAGFATHAAKCLNEVDALETALFEMRESVCSLEGRERELAAEVARLQEEMASMSQAADDTSALTLPQKALISSSCLFDATCAGEPWEPLRCVCRAYSEVVDAQLALLRTASAPVVAPAISVEEFAQLGTALDAILNKANRVANGIHDKGRSGADASCEVTAEASPEKAAESDMSVLNTAPELPSQASPLSLQPSIAPAPAAITASREAAGNASTGSRHPRQELPPGQAASAERSERSRPWFDKNQTAFSSPPGENSERNRWFLQPAGMSASSRREPPRVFSEEERLHATANAAVTTSSPMPSFESQFTERFAPDLLDYFVTSRGAGEEAQRGATAQGSAPKVRNVLDLFGAVLPAESPSKQGGDNNTFVAEFDPFA